MVVPVGVGPVGVIVGEGVTDGGAVGVIGVVCVGDGETPIVGVVPGASTVKVSVALRRVSVSLAVMVCCPIVHEFSTATCTLKVPSPLTTMVLLADMG